MNYVKYLDCFLKVVGKSGTLCFPFSYSFGQNKNYTLNQNQIVEFFQNSWEQ